MSSSNNKNQVSESEEKYYSSIVYNKNKQSEKNQISKNLEKFSDNKLDHNQLKQNEYEDNNIDTREINYKIQENLKVDKSEYSKTLPKLKQFKDYSNIK